MLIGFCVALISTTVAATVVRSWQRKWKTITAAGVLLALAGLGCTRGCAPEAPMLGWHRDPLLLPLAGVAGLGAFALLFCWPDPWTFDQSVRWRQLIQPAGSVAGLSVSQSVPLPAAFPPERLVGAAELSPPELRRLFFGTSPEGPGLTGTFLSTRFTLGSPLLVVPHAGFPVGNGNGLRIRIETPDGRTVTELACEGPNPAEIGFWTVDVRRYLGQPARLVLYDGRTETEAWVAAAPPIATSDPILASTLARRRQLENLAPAHHALGAIALSSFLLAALSFILSRPRLT